MTIGSGQSFCASFLISSATVFAQNAAPHRVAIRAGRLIDGKSDQPITNALIVIEGDKIVEAGPASEVKVPSDALIVDTSGRTMLPGLIEAHGHLITLGHGSYDRWFPWIAAHGGDGMLMRVMETAARQLLMAGVTTTVDLGAPLEPSLRIRDRINKGEVVGTRALVSGPHHAPCAIRFPAGAAINASGFSPSRCEAACQWR